MGAVDLTEAVEAASRALHEEEISKWVAEKGLPLDPEKLAWTALSPMHRAAWREQTLPVVAAAAPVIEAQVRAQIAADIEARADSIDPPDADYWPSEGNPFDAVARAGGLREAAQIARGDA